MGDSTQLERAARWVCEEMELNPEDSVHAEDGRELKRWQLKAEQIREFGLLQEAFGTVTFYQALERADPKS